MNFKYDWWTAGGVAMVWLFVGAVLGAVLCYHFSMKTLTSGLEQNFTQAEWDEVIAANRAEDFIERPYVIYFDQGDNVIDSILYVLTIEYTMGSQGVSYLMDDTRWNSWYGDGDFQVVKPTIMIRPTAIRMSGGMIINNCKAAQRDDGRVVVFRYNEWLDTLNTFGSDRWPRYNCWEYCVPGLSDAWHPILEKEKPEKGEY